MDRGRDREHHVDHEPDHDHVRDRAQPRPLAKRNPQQQHERADDHHPRTDAEAEPAREPLMQDVPRIDAKAGRSIIDALTPYNTSPA